MSLFAWNKSVSIFILSEPGWPAISGARVARARGGAVTRAVTRWLNNWSGGWFRRTSVVLVVRLSLSTK